MHDTRFYLPTVRKIRIAPAGPVLARHLVYRICTALAGVTRRRCTSQPGRTHAKPESIRHGRGYCWI